MSQQFEINNPTSSGVAYMGRDLRITLPTGRSVHDLKDASADCLTAFLKKHHPLITAKPVKVDKAVEPTKAEVSEVADQADSPEPASESASEPEAAAKEEAPEPESEPEQEKATAAPKGRASKSKAAKADADKSEDSAE